MLQSTQDSTQSSDYFDDDPEFLKALSEHPLPGDETPILPLEYRPPAQEPLPTVSPPTPPRAKRPRSPDDDYYSDDGAQYHASLNAVDAVNEDGESYLDGHTYGASRFGEFGEYMTRKRAKLQVQNAEIDGEDEDRGTKSTLFKGLQIYINGWTEPSVQDLRKLIVQHGGIFHAYLDKKSLVTHILTCSLTPAKVREFKYMKVVRPEWLVESVKAEVLLPWMDFIFLPGERVEESQGRKVAQRSLLPNLVSQAPPTVQPKAGSSRTQPHPSTPPASPLKHKATPTTPSRPGPSLYLTDPGSPEDAARVPGYAAHKSNPHAERAMADPAWRAAHTSVAPDFIEGYYRNSRLHHLSTWKAELKNLVAEAQERAEADGDGGAADTWRRASAAASENQSSGSQSASQKAVERIVQENLGGRGLGNGGLAGDVSMRGARLVKRAPASSKGKGKEKAIDAERVIMHCDFDSFFVSAGLVDRPHLRGKPVVVCHSQGSTGGASSTSEIASASYEARKFGIKGGMSLQQARKLCPTIVTIPYEFQRYKQFSMQFYTILMAHADDLQAVSVDEALIEVTSSVARIRTELAESTEAFSESSDPAMDFAEAIRAQVRKVTGCEVSIGIANNIMLARLASRRAKPGGAFHLLPQDVPEFLAPLDVDNLHGFGYSARQKAQEKLGTTNLGELAKKSKAVLCDVLGKSTGETLYKALRGIDERQLESDKPRKSVSCDINYGIRFQNNEQAETFVYQMAEEVSRRLKSVDMRGRSLTLKVLVRDPKAPIEAPKFLGHGVCEAFNRQAPLIAPGGRATSNHKIIGELAWRLLKGFNFDPKELRGIAIQIQKLEKASDSQDSELGQAVLPFRRVDTPKVLPTDSASVGGRNPPRVVIQGPSQEDEIQVVDPPPKLPPDDFDLPSFSQVDMSVFEALPDDVKKELEDEYQRRRSTTPAPPPVDAKPPSPPPQPGPSKLRRYDFSARPLNVKRISRQLAPRSPPALSQTSKLFAKRVYKSSVSVTERELERYGIDPLVFAALPPELQREQLAARRAPGVTLHLDTRKVIKPQPKRIRSPGFVVPRPPPPKAVYLVPPALKRQGKAPGEKLSFTETDDVQGVVEAWVEGYREQPPNQRDVDYFAKFLVQSVDGDRSSDVGVERAIAVAKWWLVLLRRHFGVWEDVQVSEVPPRPERMSSEYVGQSWWRAFREVKGKMDTVARKKFGGCLSLK